MMIKESEAKNKCCFLQQDMDICVGSMCMAWRYVNEESGFCGLVPLYEKKKTRERKVFTPPSKKEVIEQFKKMGIYDDSAERFINYYESNGWMVGKNKMKDWRAAVRNWVKNSNKCDNKQDVYTTEGI